MPVDGSAEQLARLDAHVERDPEALAKTCPEGRNDDRPIIQRSAAGLRHALAALGIGYRYNTRLHCHEWMLSHGWCEGTDRLDMAIRERIAEAFTFNNKSKRAVFGRDTWGASFLTLMYETETDPFKDWLLGLQDWDGVHRLSLWLGEVFETDGGPLAKWASRFVFLGAVARAFSPGLKLDEAPILAGPARVRQEHGR